MEGSFFDELRQFPFFGGDEKPAQFGTASQNPVVSTVPYSGEYISQGIYQNEESIDLTSILEACNSSPTTAVSSPSSVFSPQQVSPHYNSTPDLVSSVNPLEPVFTFSNYCPPAIVPVSSQGMYGNENCHTVMLPSEMANNPVSSVEPTVSSVSVVPTDPSDPLAGTRPSPGKMTRKTKKHLPVKDTEEWRQKRDRNNVAVRKSREKSKRRIQDTENRVKELEEENRQLQSKITLLSKELNVLKSLFTSAGVAQPPLCVKEELLHHMP